MAKRISTARLQSIEANGGTVRRPAQSEQASQSDILALLAQMQASQTNAWQQTIGELSSAIRAIPEALKPDEIEVPVEVEVPVRIDYEFKVNRDDNGLIDTVDMMDGDKLAGRAMFERNDDFKVTRVVTTDLLKDED